MQIRNATQDDISSIARMWHLGWHSGHAAIVDSDLVRLRNPESFVARTTAHLPHVHVAEVAGEIVGFFILHEDELDQFYVDLAHHGRGFAQAMMAQAEALLPPPTAWLACTVGNDRAAAFYRKCGWANTGEVVMEFETSEGPKPVNVWRFEKTL